VKVASAKIVIYKKAMKKKRFSYDGDVSWTTAPPAHEQAQLHLKSLAERALPSKTIEDRVGLRRAYDAPDSIYVRGDTVYTAGTQISRMGENFRDMYDDLKIPLGGVKSTYRYGQLQKALAAHPEVKHLVGHSLGGSAVLEAGKAIAMLDSKAQVGTDFSNPHSFENFTHTSATDSSPGHENADGSVTLFE
jgi:hypothetical protein